MTVRVRYSPAPTGEIHVGNARTALFNWLFARHVGGTFVLRIEDTDRARTTDAAIAGVQDTLRWLGVDWDEGPVRQSERTARYTRSGRRSCSPTGARTGASAPRRRLRERNDAATRRRASAGLRRPLPRPRRRPSARRTSPMGGRVSCASAPPTTGVSRFDDVIRGEVAVDWSNIHDFVILRSDGSPIFFLANAVDDIDMEITHVIRGEDLIDTTHRVLALRGALGGGAAAGVRAPPARARGRPGEALEAPRRGRGGGVPRSGIPPRGAW